MDYQIIDCHLHCGVQHVPWDWQYKRPLLKAAGIGGVGIIPPVEDVYDRLDPHFTDAPAWQACRRRAHRYLLELKDPEIEIFPYFFVWNDFAWEELGPEYVAIKWHRHPDEPAYQYDQPRCREFLQVVRERRLPILLEESFDNTLFFLERLAPDLPVVIPHLGKLNGGYGSLRDAGVWERPQTYADSSTAGAGGHGGFSRPLRQRAVAVRQRPSLRRAAARTGQDHGPQPAGRRRPGLSWGIISAGFTGQACQNSKKRAGYDPALLS